MKLNDVKHNHSLTDLLKILIFSILMMIPFIDVGVRCAYVVCNKNAYQSYYGQTINEEKTNPINNNSFVVNDIYYFNNSNYDPSSIEGLVFGNNQYRITFENIEIITNTTNTDLSNMTQLGFWKGTNDNNYVYYCYDSENTLLGTYTSNSAYMLVFKFHYLSNNLNSNVYEKTNIFYQIKYNDYSYLDNVFDYSVNKLTTSELYTWTQQTAIYTGVQTMCAQLGINNTVIPLLLVYWFILTVIYIIIDIILKLFTILTHAIGSKTA